MKQYIDNKNVDVWVDKTKDVSLVYIVFKDLTDRMQPGLKILKKGVPYIFTGYTAFVQSHLEKMKSGKIYNAKKFTMGSL